MIAASCLQAIKIIYFRGQLIVQTDGHMVRRGATIDMVFPYMDHDLAGLLDNPFVEIASSQTKFYMKEILSGLAYLHANRIIHRDIKGDICSDIGKFFIPRAASNILISNSGDVRITDFGLSRFKDVRCPNYTNRVITLWYRPPELFLGVEVWPYRAY